MILALDATYSLDPQPSGVAVYSREILSGLAAAHPDIRFRFCYRPHRFLHALREPLPRNARAALLWKSLGPRRADLFHALNQRVDARTSRRVVSTFHDLFVLTGEYSTADFRARFAEQARQAARRSDLIIAVSEFTAGQIVELLAVPRSKIRVIHHGVHTPPNPPPMARRERLILFVGAIQKRKNAARLIKAFEAVDPGWKLVLAGAQGYGAEEALMAAAASPRRADIEITGYVSVVALEQLWNRASVFAFPSLDEGFGIPVLEAMANGVAVVTSNRSALPEVAGDAALLVDPFSTESIAAGLCEVTRNDELRKQLGIQGRERAGKFSWKEVTEKTWAVYAELLGSGRVS